MWEGGACPWSKDGACRGRSLRTTKPMIEAYTRRVRIAALGSTETAATASVTSRPTRRAPGPERQPVECLRCGTVVAPRLTGKPRQFCSVDCRKRYWNHQHALARSEARRAATAA